ncbi:MAG: hypothetical protein HFH61_01805 [Lachnospiraceae bacterium]|nr:hypothetical protein [Lachnospiraceae bacterium]
MEKELLYAVLKSVLEKYERVFLIIDKEKSNLLVDFCNSNALKDSKYRVLILSSEPFPDNCYAQYYPITEEDGDMLYKIYSMYEFSDRFQVLSRETICGDLFDLFDAGILSLEEVFEAFLY